MKGLDGDRGDDLAVEVRVEGVPVPPGYVVKAITPRGKRAGKVLGVLEVQLQVQPVL